MYAYLDKNLQLEGQANRGANYFTTEFEPKFIQVSFLINSQNAILFLSFIFPCFCFILLRILQVIIKVEKQICLLRNMEFPDT